MAENTKMTRGYQTIRKWRAALMDVLVPPPSPKPQLHSTYTRSSSVVTQFCWACAPHKGVRPSLLGLDFHAINTEYIGLSMQSERLLLRLGVCFAFLPKPKNPIFVTSVTGWYIHSKYCYPFCQAPQNH